MYEYYKTDPIDHSLSQTHTHSQVSHLAAHPSSLTNSYTGHPSVAASTTHCVGLCAQRVRSLRKSKRPQNMLGAEVQAWENDSVIRSLIARINCQVRDSSQMLINRISQRNVPESEI